MYPTITHTPVTYDTSGCPSRDRLQLPVLALIHTLVLDPAWLETLNEMLAWNPKQKLFSCPKAAIPGLHSCILELGGGEPHLPQPHLR